MANSASWRSWLNHTARGSHYDSSCGGQRPSAPRARNHARPLYFEFACARRDQWDRASLRVLEFFASNIRNRHTRLAYSRAVGNFLAWCEVQGVHGNLSLRATPNKPLLPSLS
jgi:hypothetical protein